MGRAFEYRKAAKLKRWGHMAKTFTRLGKQIAIAVKAGGPDPDTNSTLRGVIATCKRENMPKDNIERAIKNALGKDQSDYKGMTYEGYGPHGIAVFVDTLTDNTTRTVADVRNIFNKNGGSMGEAGSVAWAFTYKGVILLDAEKYSEEQIMDLVLEAGAEDMETEENVHEISTTSDTFDAVTKALEAAGIEMMSAELSYVPNDTVKLESADAKKLLALIDKFEDNDDVQDVYHNAEIDEADME